MSGLADVAKGAGVKPEIVTEVFQEILARVKKGEPVRIKGFGTFERRMYPGRTLTTPAVNNGEPIEFPDSYMLKFRQSQLAKSALNVAAAKKAKKDKKPKKSKK
jgi:nucleoid DNA-binding protein